MCVYKELNRIRNQPTVRSKVNNSLFKKKYRIKAGDETDKTVMAFYMAKVLLVRILTLHPRIQLWRWTKINQLNDSSI